MPKTRTYHLHLETLRSRPTIFHLTEELWAAAVKRHSRLARRLHVTIGWDGDILNEALKTVDFMINSYPPKDGLRARAPQLKWIQTTGAGIEKLAPLDWLPGDIALTNNHGAHGAKAEQYCTMALLMLANQMPALMRQQQAGIWKQIHTPLIAGKTAVVIGFGDLGSAAGRAARKLGMKVLAVTRSGKAGKPATAAYKVSRIENVLPKADYLVVATPLTPETRGLISRARLALLQPHAALINIGRSTLIDYDALREMLNAGQIAGAILDVHDPEPLPADSPWWSTRNAITTPHISCDDPRYISILFDRWFENFERFLAGKRLVNQVDRKLGY
jgi:phosphoglycerate dehydrogenase-like enzyme